MGELKLGCVSPAKGVLAPETSKDHPGAPAVIEEGKRMGVMVGR